MNKVIEEIKEHKWHCILMALGLFLIYLAGITITFDATIYGKEYHFFYENKPIYRLLEWYFGEKVV